MGAYGWLLFLIRVRGLRSLSKMSAGDFITTVALGSILANVLSAPGPSLALALIIMTAVFVVHGAVARFRSKSDWFEERVANQPILLMRGSEVLHENLEEASLSIDDLRSKLREANVISRDQVKTVVLEVTGDVSVLHTDDGELDDWLLEDVKQAV